MSELLDLVKVHYKGVETGDLDLAVSVFSDEVETLMPTGLVSGLAAFREVAGAYNAGFPDNHFEIKYTYEQGNTIIIEGIWSGTHTGPMVSPNGTIPPTGRRVELPYADVLEAQDGKFVRHNVYFDNAGFAAQLGLA